MTTFRVAVLRGDELRLGGLELLDDWKSGSGDMLWVDIADPVLEAIEPVLEHRFGFHELAAEDCVSLETLPKYDSYPAYDFFIFRAVRLDLDGHGCDTLKLAAFLSAEFLFTVHRGIDGALQETARRLPADRRLLANGPDFLLYTIVDQMVDTHFPILDRIEEHVDDLQEEIFLDARPAHLDELLHLKRDINVMRRQSMPQRELLNQISRGDAHFVQKAHLIYFRDVYDHMFRISETIDVERDMMAGTMEAYLSVIANRTNEIMKFLTIFSALMLPMTLVAGIYGMNFEHMPELKWLHGYAWAIGIMAAIAVVMMAWFAKKGWLRSMEMPPRHHSGSAERR
jgi:magnesium transporter